MIRHFCFFGAVLFTAVLIACGRGGGDSGEHDDSSVKLFLGKLQVPLFDSISVFVSGAGMEKIHVSVNSIKDNIKIDGVPIGENRKFEVKVYADSGKLVLSGESVADINTTQVATIPIALTALYGFLILEVPLGLANTENVYSGELSLDSMKFAMQIENGKGVFSTNALPLNNVFSLNLKLKNREGKVIFTGQKQVTISSIMQNETMQLQSTQGSVILELSSANNEPMQILAMLPASGSRPPREYGDLFFTEIFAEPKSGEDFEYMEIYNATLDTLQISSCRIAQKQSNATEGLLRLNMTEGLILPPMEFLLFGRDSVDNADFKYSKFRLTNSGQSLGFFCDKLTVDSLNFTKSIDNSFPLAAGQAMQLPISNYEDRMSGESWCFGFSPKQDAFCP